MEVSNSIYNILFSVSQPITDNELKILKTKDNHTLVMVKYLFNNRYDIRVPENKFLAQTKMYFGYVPMIFDKKNL